MFFNVGGHKMVSITLSVPQEVKEKMDKFSEINWSGLIRKTILEKTDELSWREEMLQKLKGEQGLNDWAVSLQRKARKGRFNELKKRGLI